MLTVVVILLIRYKYRGAVDSRDNRDTRDTRDTRNTRDTRDSRDTGVTPGAETKQPFVPVCRQQSKPDIISPTTRGENIISK